MTTINAPVIPIGKIVLVMKEHQKEMKKIGLEDDGHPLEVFIIATKEDLENRYQDEFYFDVHEARRLTKGLILQHGKGAASIFKVKVELTDHDGAC